MFENINQPLPEKKKVFAQSNSKFCKVCITFNYQYFVYRDIVTSNEGEFCQIYCPLQLLDLRRSRILKIQFDKLKEEDQLQKSEGD